MIVDERKAGIQLLETSVLVGFEVLETKTEMSTDGKSHIVHAELIFKDEDDSDPKEIGEWGTFGFIFALAVLSFADARPRGFSEMDYVTEDDFKISDLFDCMSFRNGEIHFYADYIRGRSLKTRIIVQPIGKVRLSTWGRGEVAFRWFDRLKSKKHLSVVN